MKILGPVLQADINIIEQTEEMLKAVASVVGFPDKTPDLLFFTGIMVSSGQNLNNAYFLSSELIKANRTITNKPLDIEHVEDTIVGHIYSCKFCDQSGNILDIEELSQKKSSELDSLSMDVVIGGIIYKSRFPQISEELSSGDKWKLSMETYYQNFDIKVGNVIMTKQEAESLGIASEKDVGKVIKLKKNGEEIASGSVARVLRDLLFSGCGLVKQPANPRSIIMEVADKHGGVTMDMNNIKVEFMENSAAVSAENSDPVKEVADLDAIDVRQQTSVGLCVSYKKQVINSTIKDEDSKVLHEDWCALYDTSCTSFSRGANDPNCLRVKIFLQAESSINQKLTSSNTACLLNDLKVVLGNLRKK